MTIRAVYSDLGGVLLRTEFQTPRQHLAERIGIEYEDLVKGVFESETSHQASLGVISEDEHWKAIMRKFRLPASQLDAVRDEFFAGDITDLALVNFLRGLRKTVKVGLISNAWTGMREWIVKEKFDDAFDAMIISAEVGVAKPDPRIYQIALEKLGVAPAEAVLLDDFPENVEGARAIGMAAIHFVQPEKALDELKRLLEDHR
jgi:putative hydrolase of the HAD superfamily